MDASGHRISSEAIILVLFVMLLIPLKLVDYHHTALFPENVARYDNPPNTKATHPAPPHARRNFDTPECRESHIVTGGRETCVAAVRFSCRTHSRG
jgi:hypothetical protein